jgi:hypothetical protein
MLVPHRPGRPPACSDAEVLTFALVRHLLARPSERAFLDEVRGAWASYLPVVPAQNAFNHRVRWLWGTFASLCQHLLATVPGNSWQQLDTTTVPVSTPAGYAVRRAGVGRVACTPASAGMPPTTNGSLASIRACGPTWTAAWCAPGRWSPWRWTSGSWQTACSPARCHRPGRYWTRALAAAHGRPPSVSRAHRLCPPPAGLSGAPCRPPFVARWHGCGWRGTAPSSWPIPSVSWRSYESAHITRLRGGSGDDDTIAVSCPGAEVAFARFHGPYLRCAYLRDAGRRLLGRGQP